MRFTADWCGYCPAMASNIAKAQELYPDKVEAIHIHGTSSGLIFNEYSALDKLYGIDGYPTGIMLSPDTN
jgi:thiol-disulfide isomerase/thioredoxin